MIKASAKLIAVLLVLGSLSNVWGASFCASMTVSDCCRIQASVPPANVANDQSSHSSGQNMSESSLMTMKHHSMSADESEMDGMMDCDKEGDASTNAAPSQIESAPLSDADRSDQSALTASSDESTLVESLSDIPSDGNSGEILVADSIEQPEDACPTCIAHSGQNQGLIVFGGNSSQTANEDTVLLPVYWYYRAPSVRPPSLRGRPRQHAPPSLNEPTYILIRVFLI